MDGGGLGDDGTAAPVVWGDDGDVGRLRRSEARSGVSEASRTRWWHVGAPMRVSGVRAASVDVNKVQKHVKQDQRGTLLGNCGNCGLEHLEGKKQFYVQAHTTIFGSFEREIQS